ncbi:MAG: hypothetical protein ACT4PG_08825 [Panacagrimonas sp.]
MRNFTRLLTSSLLSVLCLGCGNQSGSAPTATPSSEASASADPASSPTSASGLVVRARGGGDNPDRFCIPTLSIANQTDAEVGALLVELEWRHRDGRVLLPKGEFASLVEGFNAGKVKDVFMAGFEASCSDLQLVVGTYACRDADAVRTPCPAALTVDAGDGVSAELSGLQEGPLRGAVEPAS